MMDILTPKGRETIKQEREAISLFLDAFYDYGFSETPKDRPADIDGIITHNGTLISGVEVKCRMMTYEELMGPFRGRWLVTQDKIDRGISLCRGLGIDFRGFLYLVPDKMLVIVPIWSYDRGLLADIELAQTETQATVNGGVALRLNAYIDITKAKRLERIDTPEKQEAYGKGAGTWVLHLPEPGG